MTQFIMALAAALAIVTAGATATNLANHPGTIVPADVHLPDPF